MNTLNRIKKYIDYKGLSIRQFEESTGFSNGAFGSQLKKGKTIGVDKLENILHVYPDLSAEWLLTGEGSMLNSGGAEASAPKPAARQEEERKGGMIEVPEAVWDVLKEQSRTLAVQSESLAIRDRQVDELIGIIKKREGADLSGALTDAAACADAG